MVDAAAQSGGDQGSQGQDAQQEAAAPANDVPANPLGLSDEEFLNAPTPGLDKTESEEGEQQESQENKQGDQGAQQQEPAKAGKKDGDPDPAGSGDAAATGAEAPEKKDGKAEKTEGAAEDGATGAGAEDPAKAGKAAEGQEEKAPDTEALANFYSKVMAPFTANGKKIELKTPEEAIALMQMGANYTRKLQELAPHRKVITMLGNHGLLDESKLSFFIALDKKDPEAIKKLIMESGIDPLDIDVKVEPNYREGSYQVTDQEVAFRTHLDDLTSTDTGKQTLQEFDHWDQASKDQLWQNPALMPIIHEHRESGIYATITAELDRRKLLGKILPTTPFLEAYKVVGDELHASGAFGPAEPEQGGNAEGKSDSQQGAGAERPVPAVVATRAAAPRPTVENGDKAGAASPTRASPGKAKEVVNFLSMSDEDFLKAGGLEGRV